MKPEVRSAGKRHKRISDLPAAFLVVVMGLLVIWLVLRGQAGLLQSQVQVTGVISSEATLDKSRQYGLVLFSVDSEYPRSGREMQPRAPASATVEANQPVRGYPVSAGQQFEWLVPRKEWSGLEVWDATGHVMSVRSFQLRGKLQKIRVGEGQVDIGEIEIPRSILRRVSFECALPDPVFDRYFIAGLGGKVGQSYQGLLRERSSITCRLLEGEFYRAGVGDESGDSSLWVDFFADEDSEVGVFCVEDRALGRSSALLAEFPISAIGASGGHLLLAGSRVGSHVRWRGGRRVEWPEFAGDYGVSRFELRSHDYSSAVLLRMEPDSLGHNLLSSRETSVRLSVDCFSEHEGAGYSLLLVPALPLHGWALTDESGGASTSFVAFRSYGGHLERFTAFGLLPGPYLVLMFPETVAHERAVLGVAWAGEGAGSRQDSALIQCR